MNKIESQDKNNTCTRCETSRNALQSLAFLTVSKARTNKLYIFRQCTCIEYLPLFQKEPLKPELEQRPGMKDLWPPKCSHN